jgi:hypothetical protein
VTRSGSIDILLRLAYNIAVNVPAARKAAERPASVTWCCGQIAALGASLAGDRAAGRLSFLPFFLDVSFHSPCHRPQNDVVRIAAYLYDQFVQGRRFDQPTRVSRQGVGHYVRQLNQVARFRGPVSHFHVQVRPGGPVYSLHIGDKGLLPLFAFDVLIAPQPNQWMMGQKPLQQSYRRENLKVGWRGQVLHGMLPSRRLFVNNQSACAKADCYPRFQNRSLHSICGFVPAELRMRCHSKQMPHLAQTTPQLLHILDGGYTDHIRLVAFFCSSQVRCSRAVQSGIQWHISTHNNGRPGPVRLEATRNFRLLPQRYFKSAGPVFPAQMVINTMSLLH